MARVPGEPGAMSNQCQSGLMLPYGIFKTTRAAVDQDPNYIYGKQSVQVLKWCVGRFIEFAVQF